MATVEYTYSLSGDFDEGIDKAQLHEEILDSNLASAAVTGITLVGDVVKVIFIGALDAGDQTTLDTLVADHTPMTPPETQNAKIVVVGDRLKAMVGAKTYVYYGGKTKVIKVDIEGQGDFTSLHDAVAAHPETGNAYVVYPGTYPTNPIVLPEKTVIKSAVGDPANTMLVATNPNAPLITMDKQSALDKMSFAGAAGPLGIGIKFDGSSSPGLFSRIQGCQIIDCYTGIDIGGPNNAVYIFETSAIAVTQFVNVGMNVHTAGLTGGDTILACGNALNKMNVGIKVADLNSLAMFGNGMVSHCNDCCVVEPNGSLNLSFVSIQDSGRGVVVNNRAADVDYPETTFKGNNVTIREITGYHVDVSGNKGEISLPGSKIQEDKINNPLGARITGSPIFTEEDRRFHATFIGEVRVGNHYFPTKFSAGEGLATITGNSILSNDNLEVGTWTDNTTAAASNDGSVFDLFSAATTGNCVYYGSDRPFYGIKANIVSTMTNADNDNLVWEYWNGTSWEAINIMISYSKAPYWSRNGYFATIAEIQYVEFGLRSDDTFTLKSLDGHNKYWVRTRITSDLSANPSFEKIKISHSHFTLHKDGYPQYFGDARMVKVLDWKLVADPVDTPGDDNFYLSKGLVLKGTSCSYPTAVIKRRTMVACIPADINTAFPIKIAWRFIPRGSGSGNVRWVVKWGRLNDGETIYADSASAPATHTSELSANVDVALVGADENQMKSAEASIVINGYNFRPQTLPHDMLWIALERDGTDAADTYASSVSFFRMCEVKYVKYTEDHHILSF